MDRLHFFKFRPAKLFLVFGSTWKLLTLFRLTLSFFTFVIFSFLFFFLASCPPAVHLSFDGLKPSSKETMVKDESGNNNSAFMKNGVQVVPSGGKCDGAVFLNGKGFKFY